MWVPQIGGIKNKMLDQQKKELVAIASDSIRKKEVVLQSSSFFPHRNEMLENTMNNDDNGNYWSLFLYAVKSPVTRKKYQQRLDKFFDFVGIKGLSVEWENQ
jgi:hypothetical protein